MRQAALKYGVDDKTLGKYLKNGTSYTGKGTSIFRPEEESRLKERILEVSNNGENLSHKVIRNVISEECTKLQQHEPQRTFFNIHPKTGVQNITDEYISRFCKRTGLSTYLEIVREKIDRPFECEV